PRRRLQIDQGAVGPSGRIRPAPARRWVVGPKAVDRRPDPAGDRAVIDAALLVKDIDVDHLAAGAPAVEPLPRVGANPDAYLARSRRIEEVDLRTGNGGLADEDRLAAVEAEREEARGGRRIEAPST